MKAGIITLTLIIACVAIVIAFNNKSPQVWYPFYKTGSWGFCTVQTFIPYTTNVAYAITFTPITQNIYYTTSLFSSCPYTIIYRSENETKK
jgi:hypothetical protein